MVTAVLYLGRLEYVRALALQQQLVELRREQRVGDVLLLLEHPPVLTLGRNAGREHILLTEEALHARGATVVETNRGGDVTYHGPGQLVGYPIFDLRGLVPRTGAVDFVRKMEEVLIRTCADYGLQAGRVPGRTGVWTQPGGSIAEKKIAAIGIHVSRGITSHGFAFNVTTDLAHFEWIVPCGITDRAVTSLDLEVAAAEEELALPRAAERVSRQWGRVFNAQMLGLDTLSDLLPEAGAAVNAL